MLKKKLTTLVLVMCLVGTSFTIGANADTIITAISATINKDLSVTLDGEKVTFKNEAGIPVPVISYNNTSYLPVRSIAALTGLDVTWNGNTQTIELIKDPVNLDNPGILDLNTSHLVTPNYFGDIESRYNSSSVTNAAEDLTMSNGIVLGAGIVIYPDNTEHDDLFIYSDDKLNFNSISIKLNDNYTKMTCKVKVKNMGSSFTNTLSARLGIYDVDTEMKVGGYDFKPLNLKKSEESEFIPLECDVTGLDTIAFTSSSEWCSDTNKIIIADIKFEK